MNMKKREEKIAEIKELLERRSWRNTGIYEVLQFLEEAGLTEDVSAELHKMVEIGALYCWFQAYNRKICGAYESDPGFVEARILEYCVNEAAISPEKAEELIAYVRVLGSALSKETITNLKPVEFKAEETKDEKEGPDRDELSASEEPEAEDGSTEPKVPKSEDRSEEDKPAQQHSNAWKQKMTMQGRTRAFQKKNEAGGQEKWEVCIRIKGRGRKFQPEAAILTGTCGVVLAGCAVCIILLGRKK